MSGFRVTQFFLPALLIAFFHPLPGYAHNHLVHKQITHEKALSTVKLEVTTLSNYGKKKLILIRLADAKTNKPLLLSDLKEVHTQKIHMMVIDDSLSDYSHVHPIETKEPGVYKFTWQPNKLKANYRIWADLVPIKTNHQEYISADLYQAKTSPAKIVPHLNRQSIAGSYQFNLSFTPAKLKHGKAAMGKITIRDAQGKPLRNLEPLMGAYAHIVGFSEDFNTIIHIHPMGAEPTKASDRGGPQLTFHIEPRKAGFIKLFAQVKIAGEELYIPFGLMVN